MYISTENPSCNLRVITHFIVSNYAPNWFAIKCRNLCTDGAKNLHHATQLLRELSSDTADIVKPYITRSAYYAHSDNILLAMLAETDKAKRSRAVDTILQCRQQQSHSNEVRKFVVPSINYCATDYVDVID